MSTIQLFVQDLADPGDHLLKERLRLTRAVLGLCAELEEWSDNTADLSEAADVYFWLIEVGYTLKELSGELDDFVRLDSYDFLGLLSALRDTTEKYTRTWVVRSDEKREDDARLLRSILEAITFKFFEEIKVSIPATLEQPGLLGDTLVKKLTKRHKS